VGQDPGSGAFRFPSWAWDGMRSIGGSRDTTWLPGHKDPPRRWPPLAGGTRITAGAPTLGAAGVCIGAALLAVPRRIIEIDVIRDPGRLRELDIAGAIT
jgi:hypothetical protein